jgi:hypothetical protein
MRLFIFISFLLITSSCEKKTLDINHQNLADWNLADKIYNKEIEKKVFPLLKNEKGLYVCESGWGLRGRDKIHVLHCGFFYYNETNLEDARALLLTAGNLYLKAINESERIRPYLSIYPLNPENIGIEIFLYNPDGSDPQPEKLQIITLKEGILKYKIGIKDSTGFLVRICEETYDEAMAKFDPTTF